MVIAGRSVGGVEDVKWKYVRVRDFTEMLGRRESEGGFIPEVDGIGDIQYDGEIGLCRGMMSI